MGLFGWKKKKVEKTIEEKIDNEMEDFDLSLLEDPDEVNDIFSNALEAYEDEDYENALSKFSLLGNHGNGESAFCCGEIYASGKGIDANISKAIEWYQKAADLGYDEAEECLAYYQKQKEDESKTDSEIYEEGVKFYENEQYSKAMERFRLAMKRKNSDAAWFIYKMYDEEITYDDDALECLEKAAEWGNVKAQAEMGSINDIPTIPELSKKAFYWYKEAAKNGHMEAQIKVAKRYLHGKDVEEDIDQAHYWFKKAAEQGDAYAQYMTARIMLIGTTLEDSSIIADAYYWLDKAAKQGYTDAIEYMKLLEY